MSTLNDLVFTTIRINLPALPPPPSPDDTTADLRTFEIALVSENKTSAIALKTNADGSYSAVRPLKGLNEPSASIQIRESGAETPLFASPPLSELSEAAAAARAEAEQAKADGAATADELAEAAAKLVSFDRAPSGKLTEYELPPLGGSPRADAAPAKGKGAKDVAPEPTGASITCEWRLQRALPTVGRPLPGHPNQVPIAMRGMSSVAPHSHELMDRERHRARYLALRYTSPHDLVAFESRMNTWRSELSDNLKIPESKWLPYAAAAALEVNDIPSAAPRSAVRGGLAEWPPKIWCEKWRAPYIPHHMRGDPLTLASKEAYVNNCETYRLDLRRQAITVELSKLQERLPLCVTAEQGVAALKAIRDFLDEEREFRAEGSHSMQRERNLKAVDAAALWKQVRCLKLPFEYLVRSVWEEGPEVEYDRVKASLIVLLRNEVARRKVLAEQAEKARKKKMEEAASGAPVPRARSAPGGRLGLLTFHGQAAAAAGIPQLGGRPSTRGSAVTGSLHS